MEGSRGVRGKRLLLAATESSLFNDMSNGCPKLCISRAKTSPKPFKTILIDTEASPNQHVFRVYRNSAERPLLQSRVELPHNPCPLLGFTLVPGIQGGLFCSFRLFRVLRLLEFPLQTSERIMFVDA